MRRRLSHGVGCVFGRVWTRRVGLPWQATALALAAAILTHALRLPPALTMGVAVVLGAGIGVALSLAMGPGAPAVLTQDKGGHRPDGIPWEGGSTPASGGWQADGTAGGWHGDGRDGGAVYGPCGCGWHRDGVLYPARQSEGVSDDRGRA